MSNIGLIKRVIKRDGRIVKFDSNKINFAVLKAMTVVNEINEDVAKKITEIVTSEINGREEVQVEDIQDAVEKNLIKFSTYRVIKEYILYRAQHSDIREYKAAINIDDELKLTPNAVSLLEGRYLKLLSDGKKETPSQMFRRTAKYISSIEKRYGGNSIKWQKIFYNMLSNQVFFPNIPCLSNAGIENLNFLAACYVLSPEDSIESIFSTARDCAIITKSGGGIGLNFSDLRPRNDIVKTTGKVSSGVVGFLPVFNSVIDSVKQGGMRRGAALALLKCDHPDIIEFINCKKEEGKFSNFNLSVAITDKFMSCVSKDTDFPLINPRTKKKVDSVRARYLLNLIAQSAWESGDPGVVFFDTYNKNNPTPTLGPMYKNACITGDTLVMIAGDSPKPIKELLGMEFPVYCTDNEGKLVIRKAYNVRKTRENQKVFKVTLDDGSFVETTEDHKFILQNNQKVLLKDLNIGDSLMRFDRVKSKWNTVKYWKSSNCGHAGKVEHRLLSEFYFGRNCDKNEVIHHVDYNGLNNLKDNLQILTIEEHRKIHDISGEKNPLFKLKLRGKFEEYKKRNSFYNTKGENNPRFGVKLSQEQVEKQRQTLLNRYQNGLESHCKGKTKENYEPLRIISEKLKGNKIERVKIFCIDCKKIKIIKVNNINGEYRCKHCAIINFNKINKTGIPLSLETRKKVSNGLIKFRKENLELDHQNKIKAAKASLKSKKNRKIKDNHKVVSIEFSKIEDVYDLTVEEFLNYAIVTSNSAEKQSGIIIWDCGETSLLPNEPCVLGSINLTKFVVDNQISWPAMQKTIINAVHFLDDVIDASDYPLPKIKEMTVANRKIGLGVMGFADLLYMLEIPYNSMEAIKLVDKLMEFVYLEAKKASEQLAKERGSFPNFNISIYTDPIRNASLTVIAPTGEISILANCSPGIEPNYGLVFKRATTLSAKELITVNPIFESIAKREGFFSIELLDKIIKNEGRATGINEIPEKWQKIFITALEVLPENHIHIQSKFQAHVDNSISKTINMPNNSTVSDVEKIIKDAYDLKCDGVTIFRDGCKTKQVMTTGDNSCPECHISLVFSEGCFHCPSCGWGKCNIA